MSALSSEAATLLIRSKNYREFLKNYMQHGRKRPITLAEVARRAKLSSRSFVANILSGERRITPATLPKFKEALGLTGRWAKFFDYLVMLDEADCRPIRVTEQECKTKLETLRNKLTGELSAPKDRSYRLFSSQYVFDLYAALGSPEAGADMALLQKRTRLGPEMISPILNRLEETGHIVQRNGRYYAISGDLDLEKLGNDFEFNQSFQGALETLRNKSRKMSEHPDCLFFHTAFMVPHDRIPILKTKIREAILETIDQQQVDDGESVVRVTLGYY